MAPTYSHTVPEDVELGGQVLSLVGDALKARFGRNGKEKKDKDAASAAATPEKKGKKKKSKSSKAKDDGGSGGSRSGAPSSAGPLGGGAAAGGAAAVADVPRILAELGTALQGHDPRCGLPIFLQQVTLINQRLGKASDPRQIEALWWATQNDGVVDFADFLRRESTHAYFAMGGDAGHYSA